jgi:hypothetical protein
VTKLAIDILRTHIDRVVAETDFFLLARGCFLFVEAQISRQEVGNQGGDPGQVILKPWQQRDLRRTTRALMSRMGVDRQVAEHCLAHTQPGVEGIYDRYNYMLQKRPSRNLPSSSHASSARHLRATR